MAMREFEFDPVLTDAFVQFGYDHYRGDLNWIPPLRREIHTQLSPSFPFHQEPGNHHRHFLAMDAGTVVGRISAMVNRELRDEDGSPVGTIGFFECIDDYAVAEGLLESATAWLREEHQLSRIWGPMNFDIWHGYRLMTRGFDQKLFHGEPYNKPYYQDFFERYGFTAKQRWDSLEITGRDALEAMISPGEERYQQLIERGYRFEPFDVRRFGDELRKLYSVLIRSFAAFLGFTPISCEEFVRLYTPSRCTIHPRLLTFVHDERNLLAGFSGAFLEVSDAIRAMQGSDHLVARLKFALSRRRVDRALFYIGGITPGEARKRLGLGRAGFYHTVRQILSEGYETVVFALLRTTRNPARTILGENASAAQRLYTLYEYEKGR